MRYLPRPAALRATFPLATQEVLELLHQLVRVELADGRRLAFLAGRRVVLLLELLHLLPGGAIASHLTIALGAKFLDGLGELRHVEGQMKQAGHTDEERLDRRRVLAVLQVVGRLAHEAQIGYSTALGGVEEDRGDAGRALVGRATVDAPGFEHRPPRRIVAASGDADRPRMGSAGQERPDRDDPLHATALSDVEE